MDIIDGYKDIFCYIFSIVSCRLTGVIIYCKIFNNIFTTTISLAEHLILQDNLNYYIIKSNNSSPAYGITELVNYNLTIHLKRS